MISKNKKTKVVVGMSGGVDSSVAAYLLNQQGFQVAGLFMKNWEEHDTSEYCSAANDLADAHAVCKQLSIPLHTINFAAEYWDNVFSNFLQEYKAGRTPNPDILCNKEIKFKLFLSYATKILKADYIAMGHYARRFYIDHCWQLIKGKDLQKDQSYFLYILNQQQLASCLFPVGDLLKAEVRKIAADQQFINYNKKDSTGICFIGECKFTKFISKYLPAQPGNIETITGEYLGRHQGLMYYTLGQRKGIGIGGLKATTNEPWYVAEKRIADNALVVAQGINNAALKAIGLHAEQVHWIAGCPPVTPFRASAKIRYRQQDVPCHVHINNQQQLQVIFDQPQIAITPGQSVVIYQGETCLGGGIIKSQQKETVSD